MVRLKANPTYSPIRGVFFIQSHTLDDQGEHMRGKSTEGTKVCKRQLDEGHLVQVHTGYESEDSHRYTHIQCLTKPTAMRLRVACHKI